MEKRGGKEGKGNIRDLNFVGFGFPNQVSWGLRAKLQN